MPLAGAYGALFLLVAFTVVLVRVVRRERGSGQEPHRQHEHPTAPPSARSSWW